MTSRVFSQHRLYTPSTPVSPMPSTRSRVKRKGTVSGMGMNFPRSKATPETSKKCFKTATYPTHTKSPLRRELVLYMSFSRPRTAVFSIALPNHNMGILQGMSSTSWYLENGVKSLTYITWDKLCAKGQE